MMNTTLLLAASMVVGQAQAPSPDEQGLKSLDSLIGCWSMDGELLEDLPDGSKKGAKMTAHVSYEWILDKHAIETEGRLKIGNSSEVKFVWLICQNRAKGCIVRKGASSDGTTDDAVVEPGADGDSWTWTIDQVKPEGEKVSRKVVLKLGENELVWQEIDRLPPLSPTSPKYTLKRCKGDHQDNDD